MTIFAVKIVIVYVSTFIAAYYTTVSSIPSIKAPYLLSRLPAEAGDANSHPVVLITTY